MAEQEKVVQQEQVQKQQVNLLEVFRQQQAQGETAAKEQVDAEKRAHDASIYLKGRQDAFAEIIELIEKNSETLDFVFKSEDKQ